MKHFKLPRVKDGFISHAAKCGDGLFRAKSRVLKSHINHTVVYSGNITSINILEILDSNIDKFYRLTIHCKDSTEYFYEYHKIEEALSLQNILMELCNS